MRIHCAIWLFIILWAPICAYGQAFHEFIIPLIEQQYQFHCQLAKDSTQMPTGINAADGEVLYLSAKKPLATYFANACWQIFGLSRDNLWREEAERRMAALQPDSNSLLSEILYAQVLVSGYEKTGSKEFAHIITQTAEKVLNWNVPQNEMLSDESAEIALLSCEVMCKAFELSGKPKYVGHLLNLVKKVEQMAGEPLYTAQKTPIFLSRLQACIAYTYAMLYAYTENEEMKSATEQYVSAGLKPAVAGSSQQVCGNIPTFVGEALSKNTDRLTSMILLNAYKQLQATQGKITRQQMKDIESEVMQCMYQAGWIADLRKNAFFIINNQGMKETELPIFDTQAAVVPDFYFLRFLSRPY